MAGMTAAEFEDVYGELTRSEYPDIHRERALSNVLAAREPPVIVPDGVKRVWQEAVRERHRLGDRGISAPEENGPNDFM